MIGPGSQIGRSGSSPNFGMSNQQQGYMFGPGRFQLNDSQSDQMILLTDTANGVVVTSFTLPFPMRVNKLSWYINGLTISAWFGFAIYSADGLTKLVEWKFQITATGVAVSITKTGVDILAPGVYWFAQSDTAGTTSGPGRVAISAVDSAFINSYAPGAVHGKAANPSALAATGFPVTLGAITPSGAPPAGYGIAFPLMQP